MQLLQSIKQYIEKRDTIFVFPSETASRFWLKRSFSFTHRRTLSHERFISWDHFKRTTFKYSLPAFQPVNEAARTLFLHHLLEENRERSFFRSIIPREYAEYSPLQITALRKILPYLNRISDIPRLEQGIEAGKKKDLLLLLDKYLEFLKVGGLFEPGYRKPELEVNNFNYLLFYPEILADFHYLNRKGWLGKHPKIKIISLTHEAPGPELKLTSFENSEEELTWVLLKVGALLDNQVDPAAIAISAPDLEQLESRLLLLSRLHEVPLQIHQSEPILRYPQARLFGNMKSCIDSGFSIESLKALLLNRAAPWKKKQLNRKLIRFAVYYRVFRNYSTPGVKIDLWRENINKALASSAEPQGGFERVEIGEIAGYFKRLQSSLQAIAESRDFIDLKEKLLRFSDSFLSTADFSEDELKVFQFSLKALNELIAASAHCNSYRFSSPFAIWIAYLEEKPYAPGDLPPGIAVYPYRLAAAIRPRYHFILNACQSATEHIIRPYPFLNIHEEYNLADILSTGEYDLSAPFIRLYSLSGEEVFFSYARKSYSGNSLPPAYFVTSGAVSNFNEKDENRYSDPYSVERALWTKEQVTRPERLYRGQLQGFSRAIKTSLKAKSLNLWHTPLDQEYRRVISRRLRYREGYLVISPSSLEQYDNCAFNFLLARGLSIDEESYLPESWEARETGNILHEIYRRFYQWIIDQGGYLERERFTLYQVQLKDTTDGVLKSYGRNQPLPIFPLWREKCRNIEGLAPALLEVDIKIFPGQRIIDVEKLLTVTLQPEGRKVKLTGRIDRIAENSKGMGVVDYKKSKTPKSRDIFGARPTSFQIPFYILLLAASGRNADWAAYYSMEEKKYIMALDNEPELQEYAGRNLAETIEGMIKNIERGDFSMATTAKKINCRFCPYEGICRHNFILG